MQTCSEYNGLIAEASTTYGINTFLLMALMYQESTCDPTQVSSSRAVGLMQITELTYNDICKGIYGNDFSDVSEGNRYNNVFCGALILDKKYEKLKNGLLFSCGDKRVKYYEWEAALRGYIGWSCRSDSLNYVEEVISTYNMLQEYSDNHPITDPSQLPA